MSNIWDGLRGFVSGLFAGKRKFRNIDLDEIRKERVRLEQTEMALVEEVERIETQKQDLFSRGAAEKSQRLQLIAARKIKELDAKAKQKDKQLALVSRQARVLSGLASVKENEAVLQDMGVSSIIGDMDLGSLAKYIDQATVDGELRMERLGEILELVESSDMEGLAVGDDEDVLAILTAMQQAHAEADAGDAESIQRGMKSAQEAMDKKQSEKNE
jgi:hypothetical protein